MRFLYTACSNHLPLLWNSPRRRIHWRCRRSKTCIRTCISPHTTVPGFAYLARCRLFHTCVCVRACMSVRERGREREREMQRERVCTCVRVHARGGSESLSILEKLFRAHQAALDVQQEAHATRQEDTSLHSASSAHGLRKAAPTRGTGHTTLAAVRKYKLKMRCTRSMRT